MVTDKKRVKGETLLDIKGLKIDGYSDDVWNPIVKGIDLTLKRGEVLGLIGESGAGKSTLGLAAMGFARPGCRISGGSIMFDGMDLIAASAKNSAAPCGVRALPMWPKVPPPRLIRRITSSTRPLKPPLATTS